MSSLTKRLFPAAVGALTLMLACSDEPSKPELPANQQDKHKPLPSGKSVYITGSAQNGLRHSIPGYWKDGVWVGLEPLDPNRDSAARSLVVSGKNVYVGGYSTEKDRTRIPGYWHNGAFVRLSPPDKLVTMVSRLVLSGEDVCALARHSPSTEGGNTGRFASGFWKNGNWTPLKELVNFPNPKLESLIGAQNALFIGVSGAENRGYLKNGVWQELNCNPASLKLFGDDLYAMGGRNKDTLEPALGYWKNAEWTPLAQAKGNKRIRTRHFLVSDGDVYLTGFKTDQDKGEQAGYWKNGEWQELTLPDSIAKPVTKTMIRAIAVSEGKVFVAGSLKSTKNTFLGYWENNVWRDLRRSDDASAYDIASFVAAEGDIYVTVRARRKSLKTALDLQGYYKNRVWTPLTVPKGAQQIRVTSLTIQ